MGIRCRGVENEDAQFNSWTPEVVIDESGAENEIEQA